MATELSRFLSEQLAGLPSDHQDRAFVDHINWLTERYINRPKENRLSSLTPREREVLGLMAQGFSNKTIGDRLVVSEKTVENYTSAILPKIGVSYGDPEVDARVAAVLLYQRHMPDFKNPFEGYFDNYEITPLSPRQEELVSLIGKGYSNAKIGRQLNLSSSKTVENYINTILVEKISVDHQIYNPRVVLGLFAQTRHITQ